MKKAIVLCGNLSDGFVAVGPFDSLDVAARWAMTSGIEVWTMTWVSSLVPPTEIPERHLDWATLRNKK
jgi:hypothetical protein